MRDPFVGGKKVRDLRKTTTLDWRLERWNYALLVEICSRRPYTARVRSQLRNRGLDLKNRISLPSERNFGAARRNSLFFSPRTRGFGRYLLIFCLFWGLVFVFWDFIRVQVREPP